MDTYSTSDSGLAAYLLSLDYKLVANSMRDSRMWFTFVVDSSDGDVAGAVADYFSGENDEVSASKYRNSERKIMDIIHASKRAENGLRR